MFTIDERQHREGWGAAVIPWLARALHNEMPEMKGFPNATSSGCVYFIGTILILPQLCHRLWHNYRPRLSSQFHWEEMLY